MGSSFHYFDQKIFEPKRGKNGDGCGVCILGSVSARYLRIRSKRDDIWFLFCWYHVCCFLRVLSLRSMRWKSRMVSCRRTVVRRSVTCSLDDSSAERRNNWNYHGTACIVHILVLNAFWVFLMLGQRIIACCLDGAVIYFPERNTTCSIYGVITGGCPVLIFWWRKEIPHSVNNRTLQ
jgi:hypothetical protein